MENKNSKFIQITRHSVNLDEKDSERWVTLVKLYKAKCLKAVDSMINDLTNGALTKSVFYMLEKLVSVYIATGNIMYKDELKSIADILELPMEKVVLIQLCYEMFAACTSVVLCGKDENVHFRTMDWPLDHLKDLTVILDFKKNNKIVFSAVSWVGYVGILTGMIPNDYSLAINFRRSNNYIVGNLNRTLNLKWPIGYLCRYILEQKYDYKTALEYLSKSDLISPCYITLCPNKGDAHIIIREPSSCVEIKKSDKYLIQTNMDSLTDNTDILYSKKRYLLVEDTIKKDKSNDIASVINKFYKFPVLNHDTIYVTEMMPNSGTIKCVVYESK
jgi:hypothetical protein